MVALLRSNDFAVTGTDMTGGDALAGMAKSGSGLLGSLRRNRGKTAIAAALAVLAAWLVWPKEEEAPPAPATVPVVRGDIESSVAASGTLEAAARLT